MNYFQRNKAIEKKNLELLNEMENEHEKQYGAIERYEFYKVSFFKNLKQLFLILYTVSTFYGLGYDLGLDSFIPFYFVTLIANKTISLHEVLISLTEAECSLFVSIVLFLGLGWFAYVFIKYHILYLVYVVKNFFVPLFVHMFIGFLIYKLILCSTFLANVCNALDKVIALDKVLINVISFLNTYAPVLIRGMPPLSGENAGFLYFFYFLGIIFIFKFSFVIIQFIRYRIILQTKEVNNDGAII